MLLVFLKMQVKETLCKRSLWTVREAITSINSESFSSWAVTAKVEMHLNLTKYTYTWSEAGWIFPLMISATEKRVMTICPQQLSQAAVSRCQGGDNHEINSKQWHDCSTASPPNSFATCRIMTSWNIAFGSEYRHPNLHYDGSPETKTLQIWKCKFDSKRPTSTTPHRGVYIPLKVWVSEHCLDLYRSASYQEGSWTSPTPENIKTSIVREQTFIGAMLILRIFIHTYITFHEWTHDLLYVWRWNLGKLKSRTFRTWWT